MKLLTVISGEKIMTVEDKDIENKRFLEKAIKKTRYIRKCINDFGDLNSYGYYEIDTIFYKIDEFFDEIEREYKKLLSENITYSPCCKKEEKNSKDIKEIKTDLRVMKERIDLCFRYIMRERQYDQNNIFNNR